MAAYYNEITVVYLITNKNNGKQYVGITKQALNRRWRGHVQLAMKGVDTALYAAIRKYGEFAFSMAPIASCLSRDSAGETESRLIAQHNTKAPHGYNLTDGGDGVKGLPREIIERVAQQNRGRKHSAETRKIIGLAGLGRKKSQGAKMAISLAHRGKKLSAEHRAKLSASKLGKKMPVRSEEHKTRISDGLRRAHARRREACT